MNTLAKTISEDLIDCELSEFVEMVNNRTEDQLSEDTHGDYSRWFSALDNAPNIENCQLDFSKDAVTLIGNNDIKVDKQA